MGHGKKRHGWTRGGVGMEGFSCEITTALESDKAKVMKNRHGREGAGDGLHGREWECV